MPPITPTLQVDPNVMSANWGTALSTGPGQAKLVYKYQHPKRLFNADPTGSQNAYMTGVQKAIAANKYANGMANANVNAAADNMVKYGGANWAQAGTSKLYKYQAKAAKLAALINSSIAVVNALPKGRGAANRARMLAWFDSMSAGYGTI